MKIAIVGPGFTGATFPLAQHIYKMGHKIDCYYLTRIGLSSIESLDFERPLSKTDKIVQIPLSNSLYNYLEKEVGIYIIPLYKRHQKLEKVMIGLPYRWANYFRTKNFIKLLLKRNYDRVILIDQFDNEQIGKALAKAEVKFVTSYHEVLDSLMGIPVVRKKVIDSVNLGKPIILHCDQLKKELIQYSGIPNLESRISVMRVGPFESLWQYGEGKEVKEAGDGYLLFMGRITPYKGLGILYDAINQLSDTNRIKIVVAGSGNDPIVEEIKKDARYTIINRFIANDEMVWLVKHSKAIVCPYIAASQSGLMPLAFAFNKPVIATSVGAFPEIIVDGDNGYLANSVTGAGFSQALSRFIEEADKLKEVRIPDSLNWKIISRKVVDLLTKI